MTPVYDGGCTGFGWVESLWPRTNACCLEHDLGGSDGQLLDCLMAVLPPWAWAVCAFGVFLMVLFRPIYVFGQRRGWWR